MCIGIVRCVLKVRGMCKRRWERRVGNDTDVTEVWLGGMISEITETRVIWTNVDNK